MSITAWRTFSTSCGVMAWPRKASSAAGTRGCSKAEHAEINASVLAGLRVVQGELHRDAGAGVHRSAPFQRDISSARVRGWLRDNNVGNHLSRLQRGGVGVEDEIVNIDAACAVGTERVEGGSGGQQHGRPIAGGIGFGDGAANRAQVAHLRIGNAGSAVVKNRNASGVG